MCNGWQRTVLACLVALTATSVAHGQVYEDRMEPVELGIGDLDSLTIPESTYVGNDTCRACHEDAYRLWLGTRHARAFVPLRSRTAVAMGQRDTVSTDSPAGSGRCLSCHATGHDVPAAYRDHAFRIGEGVACEKCHGPGGAHVGAMDSRIGRAIAAVGLGLRRTIRTLMAGGDGVEALKGAWEPSCARCHDPVPSHEMLGSKPFVFAKAWKTIAH
jgi:hypothetical protein